MVREGVKNPFDEVLSCLFTVSCFPEDLMTDSGPRIHRPKVQLMKGWRIKLRTTRRRCEGVTVLAFFNRQADIAASLLLSRNSTFHSRLQRLCAPSILSYIKSSSILALPLLSSYHCCTPSLRGFSNEHVAAHTI